MNKKEKFKKILLFALMFLLPLVSMKAIKIDSNNYAYEPTKQESVTSNVTKQSIESSIVTEARTFVKKYYPKCPDIIPTYIVRVGLENNIDICFILAQTQLETTFGKAGIGRASSKHSLFGVEKRSYKDYKEAIDDYVRLITTSYLVNGRTEQNLLKNYVNKSGHRYAGNPHYESELTRYYKIIVGATKIKSLQAQYRKL